MKATVKKKINVSSESTGYFNFGFTYIQIDNEGRPKCVIYLKVLTADSMISIKLKRHFETNRSTLINKKRDYFVRKFKLIKKLINQFYQTDKCSK